MRAWIFAGMVVSVVVTIGACVGDAATPTSAPPQGSDGGTCFPNNSCNAGLSCVLSSGAGVCRPSADGSPPQDGSLDQSTPETSTPETGTDAPSLPNCTIKLPVPAAMCTQGACLETTMPGFQCGNQCSGAQQQWTCSSSSQCPGSKCCLTQQNMTFTLGTDCTTPGKIVLSTGPAAGGTCKTDCVQDLVQLCSSKQDCPANQWCAPVTVSAGPQAMIQQSLGICSK